MDVDFKDMNNKSSEKEDLYSYKPRSRNHSGAKDLKGASSPKKEKPSKKINKKLFIIPIALILALCLGILAFSMTLPKNRTADNVYAGGIDLGNKTLKEVEEELSLLYDDETQFQVTSAQMNHTIQASDINLEINTEETAQKVLAVGKSDNIFMNAYSAVKLFFAREDVPLVVEFNREKLEELLFEFGTTINGESTEASYDFGEDSITITPGTAGQNQDTTVACEEFIEAVSMGIVDNIAVTLDYAEPQRLETEQVYEQLCKEAKNAAYEKNDEGKIIVTEETVGVTLDKSQLKEALDKVNAGNVTTVAATIIKPEKTKKDLEAKLFSSSIGSYSSDFSASGANRADNVTRASNSINGTILMPGETFSYNKTIGNPSLANGYKVASVYENGKTAQGVGGGVCQVSSTLYSAVLYADLSIVERHNHSLTVGYVPKGQDATVSYGSLDFKFKNSTDYPIKINSTISGRKLNISIVGTPYTPSRKIELSHSIVSTISPTENETKDSSLPAGTRKVTSNGKNGYVVDSFKTIYENGQKVSSKKISRSSYKMTPTEVTVGTAVASTSSAAVSSGGNNTNVGNIIDMSETEVDKKPTETTTPEAPSESQIPQEGGVVSVAPFEG